MGLDMYLKGEKYVSEYFDPALKEAVDALLPDSILSGKVCGIKFRLAYWRKANAIHQWFVNNVQDGTDDCSDYDVSREKLQELVDTCKAVLADHTKAEELLPPQSGFFFGSTEIDYWYFQALRATIEQIEPLLTSAVMEDISIQYHSSW